MHIDGVLYRPLEDRTQLKAVLNLVSRRGDPSAVVRRFLNLVRQAAKNFVLDDPKPAARLLKNENLPTHERGHMASDPKR